MTYPYTQRNLLGEPHKYMYTPYQGEALLRSYVSDRNSAMRRHATGGDAASPTDLMLAARALPVLEEFFDAASDGAARGGFRALFDRENSGLYDPPTVTEDSVRELAKPLSSMTITESVRTLKLLHAVIAVQLTNASDADVKVWIDRLVQRFEVSKKVYEGYQPGFRKGDGSNSSILLYWLLGLALCLYYARTQQLKYLSTLLKICDLLSSLPENTVREEIPEAGMLLIIAAEVTGVQLLAQKKGVSFALI